MDRERDPYEYLRSGDAWRDYCEGLKAAGEDIFRDAAPDGPIDMADAHRYLARMVRFGLEHILEGGDPRLPVLSPSLCEVQKSGWDNPDNHHTNAYVSGDYEYRIRGVRGDAHYMSFAVYGGSLGREGGRRTISYVEIDDLEVAPDGRFELVLSKAERPGNWIALADDATTLMVRETFWEKSRQRRAELQIECLDESPPPRLDPEFVVGAFRRSLRFMRGSAKVFFDTVDPWTREPNVFQEGDPEKAAQTLGIPGQRYRSGWWECDPDQALVIDVMPPRCRYWSLSLCDYWGASLDYRYWPIHVNKETAIHRSDGSVRMVVAHEDPGLVDANWLDPAGHDRGVWVLRWLEPDEDRRPEVRVVPLEALRRPEASGGTR
ncbi:MAG: DUF1214 domain-containing protein [Deltaproteobacteria bacterium]|jgi:hypothetical protein|nr:DUF1214 domain-containing protein [Deltaproteobacteria bacterium]